MSSTMTVAAIQMNSRVKKARNLERAETLVRQAAEAGATLVVLPELFNCLGPFPEVLANAESIPGETSERMSHLARELGIYLCAGSLCERAAEGRGFNASLFFGPQGEALAKYRKMHLFDIRMKGQVEITESSAMVAGDEIVTCEMQDFRVGFATCYDLRFPELFRVLTDRGVHLICFPSAFTRVTGAAHWHTLVRARAIENQVFVVAANQTGQHTPKLESFGHSLVVDPWGRILADAGQTVDSMAIAEIDLQELVNIRESLPVLEHRKFQLPL